MSMNEGRRPPLHEVAERDVESVGDEEQAGESRHAGGVFVSVDRLVISADAFAELHLREVSAHAWVPRWPGGGGVPRRASGQGVPANG